MIQHSLSIQSPLKPASARNSLLTWLQAIGYRLTSPPFLSSISLERGSLFGNMSSLSPKSWSVRIYAEFKAVETGCEITLTWTIATFGQIGTKADLEFWRKEAQWAVAASRGIMPDPKLHTKAVSRASNGNTWRAIVFTFAIFVPPIFVGWATQSMVAALIAFVVACAAAWYALRAPRELGEIPSLAESTPPPPVLR